MSRQEAAIRSGILEQHHEAQVHMVLLMTVKEAGAGIVGRELDFRPGLRIDQHADDNAGP